MKKTKFINIQSENQSSKLEFPCSYQQFLKHVNQEFGQNQFEIQYRDEDNETIQLSQESDWNNAQSYWENHQANIQIQKIKSNHSIFNAFNNQLLDQSAGLQKQQMNDFQSSSIFGSQCLGESLINTAPNSIFQLFFSDEQKTIPCVCSKSKQTPACQFCSQQGVLPLDDDLKRTLDKALSDILKKNFAKIQSFYLQQMDIELRDTEHFIEMHKQLLEKKKSKSYEYKCAKCKKFEKEPRVYFYCKDCSNELFDFKICEECEQVHESGHDLIMVRNPMYALRPSSSNKIPNRPQNKHNTVLPIKQNQEKQGQMISSVRYSTDQQLQVANFQLTQSIMASSLLDSKPSPYQAKFLEVKDQKKQFQPKENVEWKFHVQNSGQFIFFIRNNLFFRIKWPEKVILVCIEEDQKIEEHHLQALDNNQSMVVEVKFKAPEKTGKYRFYWNLKYLEDKQKKKFGPRQAVEFEVIINNEEKKDENFHDWEKNCIEQISQVFGGNFSKIQEFVTLTLKDNPKIQVDEIFGKVLQQKEENEDLFV